MKVLLTGASGFVGSFLAGHLAAQPGLRVQAVYRSQNSLPGPAQRQAQGQVHPVLVADAFEAHDWRRELDGVDAVLHVAGKAHAAEQDENLSEFRRVNVAATLKLAQAAVAAGVKRFVFISSIGVNGNGAPAAYTEASPPNPVGAYAISKYEAEVALLKLAQAAPLEVVIVRPPLIYGPGAPGSFARLVQAVQKGTPLPLGMIRNRRTLLGIDNLADLLLLCLKHPAAANRVFLAGDAQTVSTTDLLKAIGQGLGKNARLIKVPLPLLRLAASVLGKTDMIDKVCGDLVVDAGKARRVLGWTPPVSFQEGVARAVRGCKASLAP